MTAARRPTPHFGWRGSARAGRGGDMARWKSTPPGDKNRAAPPGSTFRAGGGEHRPLGGVRQPGVSVCPTARTRHPEQEARAWALQPGHPHTRPCPLPKGHAPRVPHGEGGPAELRRRAVLHPRRVAGASWLPGDVQVWAWGWWSPWRVKGGGWRLEGRARHTVGDGMATGSLPRRPPPSPTLIHNPSP